MLNCQLRYNLNRCNKDYSDSLTSNEHNLHDWGSVEWKYLQKKERKNSRKTLLIKSVERTLGTLKTKVLNLCVVRSMMKLSAGHIIRTT